MLNILGYETKQPILPTKQMIIDGLKDLKEEIKVWKEEVKEKLESDVVMVYRPNEIDVYCQFRGKFNLHTAFPHLLIYLFLQNHLIYKNG